MKTSSLFFLFLFNVMLFISCDSSIKIGDLEIAKKDCSNALQWDEAKKACADLGNGWRLPTQGELSLMYEKRDEIGGFKSGSYWSSADNRLNEVWILSFNGGLQGDGRKRDFHNVRAVKSIKQ